LRSGSRRRERDAVEVQHRGWELGAKATVASKSYDGGWDFVVGTYIRPQEVEKILRAWVVSSCRTKARS
jgi:hypothetical protein